MANTLKLVTPNGSMRDMVRRLLAIATVFTPNYRPDIGVELNELDLGGMYLEEPLIEFRSQDIPILLECGAFDIGLVGQDWIMERNVEAVEVVTFALSRRSFTPIRLVLSAPNKREWQSINDIPSRAVIATEYPSITSRYLRARGLKGISIFQTNGQTEQMPGIGAADAIVDIVETGSSLERNGLSIIEVIAESRMTLSANKSAFDDPLKGQAIRRFGEILIDCYWLMRSTKKGEEERQCLTSI